MSTPAQYLRDLPEPHRSELKQLDALIREEVPHLKPYIQQSGQQEILGYGKYAYKTKSGCEGEWFLIGLASRKQSISLYIVAVQDDKYLPELYKDRLPKAKVGKSCIRFTQLSDLDQGSLRQLIREAAAIGPPQS